MVVYDWMINYPYLAIFSLMFVLYTLYVNIVDESDGMADRYISAVLFPWAYAYYIHVTTTLMYGHSLYVDFAKSLTF